MYQRKSDGLWCEKVRDYSGRVKVITAKTETALRKKLRAYETKEENGPTFEAAAVAWYESRDMNFKTEASYRAQIARAEFYFGDILLKDITPDQVKGFVDYLAGQGYAQETVRRGLSVVNMIFKHAITMPGSVVRYNPCTYVSVPRGLKKKRREPPTEEQLASITPDGEMGLFAYFLLYTGLRRGELLALRYEDIDREKMVIHVRRAVVFENNKPVVRDSTKTPAGMRDVPILDPLAAVLPPEGEGYIFGEEEPLTAQAFRNRWIDYCRSCGLAEPFQVEVVDSKGCHYNETRWRPLVTPHQFRHQFASMLEGAGVSELEAQAVMGHASIVTTKDMYTHIRAVKHSTDARQKLNEYISAVADKGTPAPEKP